MRDFNDLHETSFNKKYLREKIGVKTELYVNDKFISLNPFNQDYVGNILKGIVIALGGSGKKFSLSLDSEELKVLLDGEDVEIRKDFVRLIIENTVKGMVSSLKGASSPEKIMIKAVE